MSISILKCLFFSFFFFLLYAYSYWDPNYDNELIKNSIALNLLYILTLSDVDHGWILTNPEIREQLNSLQKDVNKKEVTIN